MELDFPSVDFLFIDEVQDLNPVQHALVPLMCPSGRTVIVGDPYQSIYAFRGADSESIPKLKAQLDAETLPLTVTWRCPRSHVELAKQLVPDFDAAPEAAEGIVEHADETVIDQCSAGDMVLCRANAPIISACLRMVRQHRRAIVRGRALGDQLKTIVRKLDASTVAQLVRAIQVWRAKEIERLERKDGTDHLIEQVEDKAACLEAIAETCGSPAEVPGVIDNLFADDIASNRVTFSSVHRAKGSEARNVAYIQIPFSEARDRRRPPQPWELDQRRNLRYVALTRSMERLTLVTPRGR
jgi:superfamily I DNA/RNA helicase